MKLHRRTVFCLLRLLLALVSAWAATQIFDPLLMEQRFWLLVLTLLMATLVFAWELQAWTPPRRLPALRSGIAIMTLASCLLAFFHGAQQQAQLLWARKMILDAPPHALHELGRHIIVGYTDVDEVSLLARQGLIGGIYIGKRNTWGRTTTQIREEIMALQQLRSKHGLPQLWVAAEQEGGMVSQLSPPLPLLAPLSQITQSLSDPEARSQSIFSYAALQGRQLASLGVNLNLAPVVDVNPGQGNADPEHPSSERAISADAEVVTQVAGDFCAGLAQNDVHCTLKHFPGLGRESADAHHHSDTLTTPLAELERSDWIPFKALMHRPGILTMLGHTRLTAIDANNPASFSPAVIGMLRQDWGYQGLLITDDFCLGAVYASRSGMGGAAVSALNSGVDLILVGADPSQYYLVMRALLKAQAAGRIRQDALEVSARRLLRKWSMVD